MKKKIFSGFTDIKNRKLYLGDTVKWIDASGDMIEGVIKFSDCGKKIYEWNVEFPDQEGYWRGYCFVLTKSNSIFLRKFSVLQSKLFKQMKKSVNEAIKGYIGEPVTKSQMEFISKDIVEKYKSVIPKCKVTVGPHPTDSTAVICHIEIPSNSILLRNCKGQHVN